MRAFLELLDARLEAIEPWWRRVVVLCVFLVLCSNAGDLLWREHRQLKSWFWTGGMFGPVTYVLFGPLQVLSILAMGFVGYRFLHAQKGDSVAFCFLGLLVALNTGYYGQEPPLTAWKFAGMVIAVLAFLGLMIWIRYGSRRED